MPGCDSHPCCVVGNNCGSPRYDANEVAVWPIIEAVKVVVKVLVPVLCIAIELAWNMLVQLNEPQLLAVKVPATVIGVAITTAPFTLTVKLPKTIT